MTTLGDPRRRPADGAEPCPDELDEDCSEPATEDSTEPAAEDAVEEDHRRKPRRRGAELRTAIYRATLDELTEQGYANLTMDRVAARAKASKGSLYRRWPGRAELVIDAINNLRESYEPPPTSGDLRGELLYVMRAIAESLEGPRGEAVRGLIAELSRHPELARRVRSEIVDSALPPMLEVLRRGVVRHEVRPGALTPMVARVGPSLIRQQLLTYGQAELPAGYLEDVVDQVVLPLVIAHVDDQ
jgi:AcrR family transcriptional regulator